MDMAPSIWRSLPIELIEMIFLQLPLSTIIRFRTISKEWIRRLLENSFMSSWRQCGPKEFGALVNFHFESEKNFHGCYINQLEKLSPISMPFLSNTYKIESVCGSIVLLSLPSDLYRTRDCYIINPFTKTYTFIMSLNIGDWGFFTLLRNVQQQKYELVVFKHVYSTLQLKYFMYSTLHEKWRQTYPPNGDVLPPKNAVLHYG